MNDVPNMKLKPFLSHSDRLRRPLNLVLYRYVSSRTANCMIEITRLDETNLDLLDGADPEIFDEDVKLPLVKEVVKDRGHIMLLAVKEGSVIGQILGNVHKHVDKHTELYIDDLAVSDNCLRQGVASLLVRKVMEIGKQQGCKQVWIATEPNNEPANKLYESLGLNKSTAYVFDGKL